ncbi:MAG TPA: ABC transporter substrate-binding protein [Actinomycetota bacterium]|nr:ABC transporter substrate-binding protein [Actinomycetota bacterium]
MSRGSTRLAATALAAALVLTGCDSGDRRDPAPMRRPVSSPAGEDTTIIGLVGTMTGPEAWRGEDAFEGADLAVHELNRGGSDEREFELVTLDDEGDPGRAVDLVTELALSDRTAGIVYAGPPEALQSAEPALEDAGIPAVLCYGDLYSARLLEPNLFQVSPPYLWQARRLAAYLYRDRRYTRVGVLAPRTLSGRTARQSFAAAARRFGRRPVVATYELGAGSLRRQLLALARRDVHAVVVDGSPSQFATVQHELRVMGATYRTTQIARRPSRRVWRPQLAGFDLAMSPRIVPDLMVPGTVVSDDYARGSHYLPIPSFRAFRRAFDDWWGEPPLGWERRAYEAARMIGWATARAATDESSIAAALETLRSRRFGGLGVVLGPDDHTSVNQPHVGLWVVPRPGVAVRERQDLPEELPWVPLARGFSIDGETTDVAARDWRYLFRGSPSARGPAPKNRRWRFGVATPRSDPVH